jgi:hypothetical protein
MKFLTPTERLDQLIDQMEVGGLDVSTLRQVSTSHSALATAAASLLNRKQRAEWAARIGEINTNDSES